MRWDVRRRGEWNPEPTAYGEFTYRQMDRTWTRGRARWPVAVFLSELIKRRGSERNMSRRDSYGRTAQKGRVSDNFSHTHTHTHVHLLTVTFHFRCGGGRRGASSLSSRIDRRPGCHGSISGPRSRSQQEHRQWGGADGTDRSCVWGKIRR